MRGFERDRRALLGLRIAPGFKILVITALSIALMTVDHAGDRLTPVRRVLAVALQPLWLAAELPRDTIDRVSAYLDRGRLIDHNRRLSRQILVLQGRLQKLAALEAENRRIRALLASARSLDQRALIARIVALSPDPYRQSVQLNKGSRAGVFRGQALIDAHGVMGQVTAVTPVSAQAVLISDPSRGVPVEVNRTGLQTIAQGVGQINVLKLPFLANNADIRRGDLLVTSGLGGRYPAGYPVAHIATVAHQAGEEFLDVTATPTAHLNRGREVLLVWNARSAAHAPDQRAMPSPRAADPSPRASDDRRGPDRDTRKTGGVPAHPAAGAPAAQHSGS